MAVAYLDTNAAVWLQAGDIKRFSRTVLREIERCDLLISPMVYLEFEYLRGGRGVRPGAERVFADLSAAFDVRLCQLPFASVGVLAAEIGWTSDPFDRLIVANAWANQESILITSDEKIRAHYKPAVW